MRVIENGPIYALWWPAGENHGHQLIISVPGERLALDFGMIEDFATELADAVANCSEDRHEGHGKTHTNQDIRDAFDIAKAQLQFHDYDGEWAKLVENIRKYKQWGGTVPHTVLFYDADMNPIVMTADPKTGAPVFRKGKRDFDGLLPRPDPSKVLIDPTGMALIRKRQLSPTTKLRRLMYSKRN